LRTWNNSEVVDVVGNSYSTVLISDQIWMSENLGVTRYADGSPIPLVEDDNLWDSLDYNARAYCWYDNDSATYAADYGALYTWSAAMRGAASSNDIPSGVQGVCPDGWHLPSNQELTILVDYLGGEEVAGGKMKEAGTSHWANPNTGATNESGFTALPGGYRTNHGAFNTLGWFAYWYTSTNYYRNVNSIDPHRAYNIRLYYDHAYIPSASTSIKQGSAVRCLKD